MTPVLVPKPTEQEMRTLQEWAAKVGVKMRQTVDEAIRLVQMGLGNKPKLDAVREAWNDTATGHVATATNGIGGSAYSDLKSLWSGPAFESFEDHQGNVEAASGKVTEALQKVGEALTKAGNQVVATYNAVANLISSVASAILEFAASVVGQVQVDLYALAGGVAESIINALNAFAQAYAKAVQDAMTAMAEYKNAANDAAAAIAKLGKGIMPGLPRMAGDPNSYVPKKIR